MTDRELLTARIATRKNAGSLDVNTLLKHFIQVNYAIPPERMSPYIPDQFEIYTIELEDQQKALISVVNFYDTDFHFRRLFPFLKFNYYQTNFRTYLIHKETNEHCVWFFGTIFGSGIYRIPKMLWQLPWRYGDYRTKFTFKDSRYHEFQQSFSSGPLNHRIHLTDSGEPMGLLPGFTDLDHQKLILTHPVTGFFARKNGEVSTYSIWHPEMYLTTANATDLYFGLYEDLELLKPNEMLSPHSILVTPAIEYDIHLPPLKV